MSLQEKESPLKLFISVKGGRNRIYIGKDVIRALGIPHYVCIKINENKSALAILPGEENEYMAFKVPEKLFTNHKIDFTINSKSFVYDLLSLNGLDTTKNHTVQGVYFKTANAVIFKFKTPAYAMTHELVFQ